MTDFTSEFIAKQRKIINNELPIEAATQAEYYYSDALDEIECLQSRVQEVEGNREHIEMLLCKAEKRIEELEEEKQAGWEKWLSNQQWISVSEAALKTREKYIVVCKNKEGKFYSNLAQYFHAKKVLEEDFISDEEKSITEYDIENDYYWIKEGWFEYNNEGEIEYRIPDEVIFVMPLPQLPKESEE